MTSLAEAESRFGHVVRGAGGVIFGIEKDAFVHEEKLQIGTPDGFVKMAVLLNQPNIDAILQERTAVIIKHASELRAPSRTNLASSLIPGAPAIRR